MGAAEKRALLRIRRGVHCHRWWLLSCELADCRCDIDSHWNTDNQVPGGVWKSTTKEIQADAESRGAFKSESSVSREGGGSRAGHVRRLGCPWVRIWREGDQHLDSCRKRRLRALEDIQHEWTGPFSQVQSLSRHY